MIFSENRRPPSGQARGHAFPDQAPVLPRHNGPNSSSWGACASQGSRRIEAKKSAPRPHGSRRRIRASSPWGA